MSSMVKSPCCNWKGFLTLPGSLTSAGVCVNLPPVGELQSVPVSEEIAQKGRYLGTHSLGPAALSILRAGTTEVTQIAGEGN